MNTSNSPQGTYRPRISPRYKGVSNQHSSEQATKEEVQQKTTVKGFILGILSNLKWIFLAFWPIFIFGGIAFIVSTCTHSTESSSAPEDSVMIKYVYLDVTRCLHSSRCSIVSNPNPQTELQNERTQVKQYKLEELYKAKPIHSYCGACVKEEHYKMFEPYISANDFVWQMFEKSKDIYYDFDDTDEQTFYQNLDDSEYQEKFYKDVITYSSTTESKESFMYNINKSLNDFKKLGIVQTKSLLP
ncbi:MAG: hypothetical protein MJZ30_12395 [Paludibacteraceae bacterium]|nr:hypothetical protein [Paludibacteraceae bacterium]